MARAAIVIELELLVHVHVVPTAGEPQPRRVR